VSSEEKICNLIYCFVGERRNEIKPVRGVKESKKPGRG
jgi:hypothetical protein